MQYQTYPPSPALQEYVQCYWTLDGAETADQTVVPDGCMEMIFHYGDLYQQGGPDGYRLQPRCFVIGQLTGPLHLRPTGTTGIFSVRFHPDGFLPFATRPIASMENTAIALGDLYLAAGGELENQVLRAASLTERITAVEAFLLRHHLENTVKSTLKLLMAAQGQLPVNRLAQLSAVTPRMLERRFRKEVGLSPKQLSKIVRLQQALHCLLNPDMPQEHSYYDQAHFIRDFKAFTGLTPKAFFGKEVKMSRLFYEKR